MKAFIDACASYAESKGKSLASDAVDLDTWQKRFDKAYPPQRSGPSGSWPLRVGVVPGLADWFQTRALVDELADATDDGGTAVLTGFTTASQAASIRLLSGMGGVGKTQLAVDLANHLYDTGQLDLLMWITATSREAITAGYAQAAIALALAGADGSDTGRDAARFHAWLATTDKRWLVVLDDLGTAADLKGLWPPTRPAGSTVVTTRLRGSALSGPSRRLVPVGGFTPAEAAAYLQNRLTRHLRLADGVEGLAAALHHLPLALAHAIAYMIDEDTPCSEYQQRLTERGRRLEDLAPPTDELPDDYTRTVAATVSLSVDAANQIRPAGLATPLLNLASVLDPAGIPAAVFSTTAARNWLTHTLTSTTATDAVDLDADTIRSGLRVLHRLNLITDTDTTVTVHGLVQRATRDQLTDDDLADLAWAAADALTEIWPTIEHNTTLGQALRANATVVCQHGGDTLLAPHTHPVLHRAISSLGEAGNVAGAATASEELFGGLVRLLGPDHPDTLAARAALVYWRGHLGDAADAAAATEQLLKDVRRLLGPDHPDTLATANNLAGWRGEAGDAAGAAAVAEKLLADCVRVLGPDHPHTLLTRNSLARWQGEAGDVAGAAAATEKLLNDCGRVLGPDHPQTLLARNNHARWREELGDAAGALAIYESVLAEQTRLLGPHHPHTLMCRNTVVRLRGTASDASDFQRLLDDRVRVLGPDHPHTLVTEHEFANWQGDNGSPAAAVHALEQVLTDHLRVHGPNHPETLVVRNNIASWLAEAGEPTRAIASVEQFLADQVRILGADHLYTLATRANLARWLSQAGNRNGSVAAYEQLLPDQLRILGADHPDTLTTRHNLAASRGETGDPAGAVTALEGLLTDMLRVLGSDHPNTLTTRNNLAHWRGKAGNAAGAATVVEDLLTDMLRLFGPDHPNTLTTRCNRASWRGRAGDPAGAAAAFEELLADQLRVLGPDHPNTLTTRNNLAAWRRAAIAKLASEESAK